MTTLEIVLSLILAFLIGAIVGVCAATDTKSNYTRNDM